MSPRNKNKLSKKISLKKYNNKINIKHNINKNNNLKLKLGHNKKLFVFRTSRFKRKTDRGNFDLKDAVQAVKAVKLDNKAVRAAAVQYNVPKSTLWRYVDIVSKKHEEISTVSDEQLLETIQHVGTYAACVTNQVSIKICVKNKKKLV